MAVTLPSLPRARDLRAALPASASVSPRERLLSLDVFRGITVAGMLLVNDPGSWESIYPPLEHATWNGWTPTDLVFPFFLFIVGITTYLSLSARRARGDDDRAIRAQIIRRGALIFLFGLLINGFPYFTWGDVAGVADPSLPQRMVDRLLHWRILGVLQRIGIAYTIAALLTLRTTVRQQVVILAAILFGYWMVMTVVPVPGEGTIGALLLDVPSRTMAAWVDRTVLAITSGARASRGIRRVCSPRCRQSPRRCSATSPAAGSASVGRSPSGSPGSPPPVRSR